MTNTKNREVNPNDTKNREARKLAQEQAQEALFLARTEILADMQAHLRIHSHLLMPYLPLEYTYKSLTAEGIEETKTGKTSVMFPLSEVVNALIFSDIIADIGRLTHRLQLLFTARAREAANPEGVTEIKRECKKALQEVFSRLEYHDEQNPSNDTRYIANYADVEVMYLFAFKFGRDADGKPISTKKPEVLIPYVIYALWSKLQGKGYTLGCTAKMPEHIEKMLNAVIKEVQPQKPKNAKKPDEQKKTA